MLITLASLSLPGCAREEVRLAPVVSAIAMSDGFRHMPIPSRPLVLYADLPIADSLSHPDSIAWLSVAQDRWSFVQQRSPDAPVQICPDEGWMVAIRAAQAYTNSQQSKAQR